jgi:LCP family protein required for cell wall assembly
VLIRGHYDKINAAMAYGGPELTAQVCSELLGGVPIRRWVQVNTAGLEQVVDAMGGVSLTVEKDMRYVDHTAHLDIDIRKGTQTLTGTQAHQFVRFRHDELGDIGRVQRQQQFLRAVAGQLLRPDTLPKLPTLLATVQKNLSTNMSGTEMLRLGLFAPRLSRERIQMVMLPGAFSAGKFAASYWLVSPDAASALGHRLLAGQGAEALAAGEARGKLKLTVLNGTPHEGVASAAALVLRADGWNVWSVGDAPQRDCARTRVIAQTGYDQLTGELAKPLGVSPENVAASVGDLTTDFTVVVGEDFAAKHATADTASRP